MSRSLGSLKMGDEECTSRDEHASFKCDECDGTFEKPLLATVSLGRSVEKYFACPRCLSKVEVAKHERKEERRESSAGLDDARKVAVKSEESGVKCKYSPGYLRKHPKDKPFPDECLTCDKMIECMTR